MTNNSRQIVEKIKSVVIVVLFFLTILLLYFFWEDISFESIVTPEANGVEALSARDVLIPDEIIVCSGNETYEVIENGFKEETDGFRGLAQSEGLMTEEITESQYREIMAYPSIKAVFSYYVPFDGFCEAFEIKKPTGSDIIDDVSEIGYSLGSRESIFVADKSSGKYFRIVGTPDESCFAELRAVIENSNAGGSNEYYALGMYMGEGVESDVPVPLNLTANLHDFTYTKEFDIDDTEIRARFAKSFFGSNFDFVRKIEEKSGTVIYMYGYGEKTFIADAAGTFEYKQEEDGGSTTVKYFEALDKALKFVAEHGDFKMIDGTELSPYLENAVLDPFGKKGFRFCFGFRAGSGKVIYQSGAPIIVDVIGGKVTYFKRDVICFNEELVIGGESQYEDAFSAVNMLAQNYDYILKVLDETDNYEVAALAGNNTDLNIEDDIISNKASDFDAIVGRISGLSYGYVRLDEDSLDANDENKEDKNDEMLMKACWIVSTDTADIYFDLYSAQPLGYKQNRR